ncbi:RidA family protein [Streptomyces sp. NPDC015492]|uniref:RidA family protein n=1 Tax=Streptomyces sp. NPDC015492 TaxID=3364958 RepID=UPI0036F7908D
MTTRIIRTPGQIPRLPGATRAGDLIFTSGLISPSAAAAAPGEIVPFAQQARETLAEMKRILEEIGASTNDVVRVEAYLARREDFTEWNDQYNAVFPEIGPARITLVTAFASEAYLLEIQATAVCAGS